MKKILLILAVMLLGCGKEPKIVTNKFKTPIRYKIYTGKYDIYVDSTDFYKNIKLGNSGDIINIKYYLVYNHKYHVRVSEYRYNNTKRLDTIK